MNEQGLSRGCPKCGRIVDISGDICPHCGYKFSELNEYFKKMEKEKFNTVDSKYAGFLKRTIAFLTDIIFVTLICLLFISFSIIMQYDFENYIYVMFIIAIFWIYKIAFEGIISATIGKKLVGIKVTTLTEEKINIGKALLRNLCITLDVITSGIGIVMMLFNKKSMALHDVVSKTLVINSEETLEIDDYAPGIIRILAFAIDIAVLYGIAYLINMGVDYIEGNYIMSIELSQNIKTIEIWSIAIISFFYFVLFESGSSGSSIGKKIFGIRIKTLHGNRMSTFVAIIRTICLFIEIITFGFMLCLITNKKQTLKDRIVDTKVIRI